MDVLTGNQAEPPTGRNQAADWRHWLINDPLLSPDVREGYRRTLEGFEQFCAKRGGGASASAQPTVALAREFVELLRLEWVPEQVSVLTIDTRLTPPERVKDPPWG